MKVLLKRAGDGSFLKDSNRWTDDFAEALDFKTTPAAMDYSRVHGFRGMLILLKFVDARYDLELEHCC
jgi:hypothetical protein